MRWLSFLSAAAILCALGVACASAPSRPQAAVSDAPLPLASVPVPMITPFERHPEARATYLEAFRVGYLTGRGGMLVSRALAPDYRSDPRLRGLMDGENAGLNAYLDWKEQDNARMARRVRRR